MSGSVVYSVVFVESNGGTANWLNSLLNSPLRVVPLR
jgi:hypothetical protein